MVSNIFRYIQGLQWIRSLWFKICERNGIEQMVRRCSVFMKSTIVHCEGILTPIFPHSFRMYKCWYFKIERTRQCQITFKYVSFLSTLLLSTPFRMRVIVLFLLFLYHLFLYAIMPFFLDWTYAFDYNFRKRYYRNSDITRTKIKLSAELCVCAYTSWRRVEKNEAKSNFTILLNYRFQTE